ncbi:SLC26A/SulP transporter family protein [Gemmatimonadota bacterium]
MNIEEARPTNIDQLRALLPNLVSGVFIGTLNIAMAISLAALIFAGDLVDHLPAGAGVVLIAFSLTGLIIAIGSSLPGVLPTAKSHLCVILALMAASIASSEGLVSTLQILPTIVAAIMVSTVLTGVFLFILGSFQIGNLVRFIPYPVLGGYLAGAGFLLVKGSFTVMTGVALEPGQIHLFLSSSSLILWIPGIAYAILLYALERRIKHFLLMPVLLLAGVVLFYSALMLTNTSIVQAQGLGLLFENFPAGRLLPPMSIAFFSQVNVPVLLGEIGNIMTIVLLGAFSVLLTTCVIEIGTERDIHLGRELKVTGVANIITGLVGGILNLHSAPRTILSYKLGAESRLAGIFNALFCGAAIFVGHVIITYMPIPVIGGLLAFFGISLLAEWVYDAWFRLQKADYLLVIFILIIVVTFGYLEGVGIGIIIAGMLFVVNYSRMNVVKHELSGSTSNSKVERAGQHKELLQKTGEQVYILVLQGYIFFGTADRLLNQIRQRLDSTEKRQVRFVVLDFRLVSNIDSSAVNSLLRLRQLARKKQMDLVFADLNAGIRQQLQHIDYFGKDDILCRDFPDLDHALEWCEDNILLLEEAADMDQVSLSQQLGESFFDKEAVPRLMNYFEHLEVPAGECLFSQGDISENLYFIESGKVSVLLELGDGKNIRLQTMSAGTVLGEMGLFTKEPRSATAVTEEPTSLYCLSNDSFHAMQTEDPEVALAFHRFVVCTLAARIVSAHGEVKALIT